jgi:DNA-binding MarR family transcriptional regulator
MAEAASSASTTAILGGGGLLNRVGRELAAFTDRRLREVGLTSQQAALLLHASRDARTPTELAAELGTDTAGMTRLLDRVAAMGLVERVRHPVDRRSVTVGLTERGRALLPELGPIFGRVTSRVFAGFTDEEVATTSALLGRMLDNLAEG